MKSLIIDRADNMSVNMSVNETLFGTILHNQTQY